MKTRNKRIIDFIEKNKKELIKEMEGNTKLSSSEYSIMYKSEMRETEYQIKKIESKVKFSMRDYKNLSIAKQKLNNYLKGIT